MKAANHTFGSLPTTIFEKMTRLAIEHQSINLAQGFPDKELEGPKAMLDKVNTSMQSGPNQYAPMLGIEELRRSVASHSQEFTKISIDWSTQTVITIGATEALASSFLGLLNPGDEAIVIAPMYDSYVPMIERAGGTAKIVNLYPPSWNLDKSEVEAAFSPNTKLLVLNTPHNPTGKVFKKEELQWISELCVKHNVYVVLDEVYQFATYPGIDHVSMQSLDGMFERCLRIGSAGKTFSFTDFKIGWMTGPAHLITAVAKAHQFIVFSVNSALQKAVAHGLDNEKDFYLGLGKLFHQKRCLIASKLESIGFDVLDANGTYFLVADFAPVLRRLGRPLIEDNEFCSELTQKAGVTVLPMSGFFGSNPNAPKTLVRFVICKTDEKLLAACSKLEAYLTTNSK